MNGVWGVGLVAKGWKMNRLIGTIRLFLVSVWRWWTQRTDEGLANPFLTLKHDVTGFLVEYPDRNHKSIGKGRGMDEYQKQGTQHHDNGQSCASSILNLSVRACD